MKTLFGIFLVFILFGCNVFKEKQPLCDSWVVINIYPNYKNNYYHNYEYVIVLKSNTNGEIKKIEKKMTFFNIGDTIKDSY